MDSGKTLAPQWSGHHIKGTLPKGLCSSTHFLTAHCTKIHCYGLFSGEFQVNFLPPPFSPSTPPPQTHMVQPSPAIWRREPERPPPERSAPEGHILPPHMRTHEHHVDQDVPEARRVREDTYGGSTPASWVYAGKALPEESVRRSSASTGVDGMQKSALKKPPPSSRRTSESSAIPNSLPQFSVIPEANPVRAIPLTHPMQREKSLSGSSPPPSPRFRGAHSVQSFPSPRSSLPASPRPPAPLPPSPIPPKETETEQIPGPASKATPRNAGIAAAAFVAVVLAIFGIIAIVAISRSDSEDAVCGDSRQYILEHDHTTASGAGYTVDLKNLQGIAQRGSASVVVSYTGEDDDSDAPPILTLSLGDNGLVVEKSEGAGLFTAPGRVVVEGSSAEMVGGNVWVADTDLEMVVRLSALHGSGVGVALGRYGSAGDGVDSFDSPGALSVVDQWVLVLDINNCRVKVFTTSGELNTTVGACDRLVGSVGMVAIGKHIYVATQSGIVVYEFLTGDYISTYNLEISSHPLDYLKYSLQGEPWRYQITSLSYSAHTGHLVSIEGGQIVLRTLEGVVQCHFGSVQSPVDVAMIQDQRILVAEEDSIKVYSLSQ